jgi:hypothetical protein
MGEPVSPILCPKTAYKCPIKGSRQYGIVPEPSFMADLPGQIGAGPLEGTETLGSSDFQQRPAFFAV